MKQLYKLIICLLVSGNHIYGTVLQTENEVSLYIGQRVSVNGRIVHVCPVAGKLLKFQLSDNAYLQVLPPIGSNFIVNRDSLNNRSIIYAHDTLFFTKEEWMQKEIVLQGMISERRLSKQYIDSIKCIVTYTIHACRYCNCSKFCTTTEGTGSYVCYILRYCKAFQL